MMRKTIITLSIISVSHTLTFSAGSSSPLIQEESEERSIVERPISTAYEVANKVALYNHSIQPILDEDPDLYHQRVILSFKNLFSSNQRNRYDLINLKASTVYSSSSSDFLQSSQGHLLSREQANHLFRNILGSVFEDFQNQEVIRMESLWPILIQHLELPSPRLNFPVINLQEAYLARTEHLINLFNEKFEEDIFCFGTICGMLSAYNKNSKNATKIQINLEPLNREETYSREVFYERGIERFEVNKKNQKDEAKALTSSFLKSIFKSYKMRIDNDYLEKLSQGGPVRLLGKITASLQQGHFYSWMSDRSLLIKTKNKLEEDCDISQEVIQAFYNLLGRFINREALLLVKDSLVS